MTRESVDTDALEKPGIFNRTGSPGGTTFLPFQVKTGQNVPNFLPIGADVPVRQTSSTHGANGYITTDQYEISRMLKRLKTKLESSIAEFSFYELNKVDNAEILLITYGVSARAAKAVFKELENARYPISLLILKTLWPVPEEVICRAAKGFKRVLVVEMKLGQYVREIKRILADRHVDFYGQMDGRLITPAKIKGKIING